MTSALKTGEVVPEKKRRPEDRRNRGVVDLIRIKGPASASGASGSRLRGSL